MIYFVTRLDNERPIRTLLYELRKDLRFAEALTYEQLFHKKKAPVGHYIFTDHDRLTVEECEAAMAIASALRRAEPGAQILNSPGEVLERYPLLRSLKQAGLNQFSITRLDDGTYPERYPVFVRSEDDHSGPDTGLLFSQEELDRTLDDLKRQGKSLKRRVAIEFCAEQTPAGAYRKYGAINVNGTIVPQHIIESEDWNVKSANRGITEALLTEELDFVRTNPHQEHLKKIFQIANIGYGRADYGIVDGKLQIYEINTNPSLPRLDREVARFMISPKVIEIRQLRRNLIRRAMLAAFERLNAPPTSTATVRFTLPAQCYHRLHAYRRFRIQSRRLCVGFARLLEDWEQRNPKLAKTVPIRVWIRSLRKSIGGWWLP